MIDGKTVSLVMPCRNESKHLELFISRIPDFFDQIILVSNKSTDDTFETAQSIAKTNSRLLALEDNRTADGIGYGFAHMTGMAHATSDIIVCADADGTYPIEDTPRILAEMTKRHLDFVSCSRYPDPDIPAKLQLGVKVLNAEICLLYGFKTNDSLSGMWVFKRSCVGKIHLTEGDWNLSPQIKINAHKYLKNKYAEIKVKQNLRLGETKQDYFKTGWNHLKWIFKNRFKQPQQVQKADK